MAATTQVQVIIDAKDNASKVLKSVGNSASSASKQIETDFRGAGLAATGLLASIAAVAKGAIDMASSVEQNRISFETMLGSAKKAKDMLAALAKFTLETPFEMPQVVQGAKSLMAYGIEAEKIIPTFKMLGDVAAGVGMDKLPNLVLAFGQVKAATRLTGMELRQFTEAGVPLLEMLATQFGKPVSAIKEMVSAGEIGFPAVEQALASLTGEGGRFQDMMLKQSKSFAGLMSNIRDRIKQALSEIAGVSVATGEIREGSLFAVLKYQAEAFYNMLSWITPKLITLSEWISKNQIAIGALAGVITGLLVAAFVGLAAIMGPALLAATQFVVIGALVGAAIGGLLQMFGGAENIMKAFGDAFIYIKGTATPLIDVFQYLVTRLGQIFKSMGISGEFGTIINTFQTITEKVDWYSQRLVTIVGETWQKIKNFLAFGGTTGDATIIQALEGIWNRIKPIKEALEPLFEKMGAQLALTGQIIQTQVIPAWNAFIEVLGPFWAAVKPEVLEALKNFLMGIAIAIGAIVSVILAVITGIASGLANALPFIAQAIEGIIQFFRGLVQFVTGIINGDWAMALEGMKQMAAGAVDFVINVFGALIKFISGFVQGVIAFFRGLYNTLVGHSIIPEMCNAIMSYFTNMKNKVIATVKSLADSVVASFEWIRSKVEEVISFIGNLINNFRPKIEIGLTLPDVEGAWNSLKARAHNIGVPGFAVGGVVPGPIGAPVLATVHGGEVISPNGRSSGGESGGSVFNVYVGMYAGTETEKRNIARDLYSALVQVATSQNKTVQELLGG